MFSGGILHRGGSYNYTGKFDSNGAALLQGDVGGINRTISLQLQKTNSAGLITGTLNVTAGEVRLERLAAALPTSNAPPIGAYTFVLPVPAANAPSQLSPGGEGYATGTLAASGALSLSGTLGDGTAFTSSGSLTRLNR